MKINKISLLLILFFFVNQCFAINQGGINYKIVTGNLRPTPGCKSKQKAFKQATSEYRFKKYSKVLCQQIAYGWRLAEVKDQGEVICEVCESKDKESGKYQCYVKNVTLKCGKVDLGW
jgi:hypothetical protein